jgi:hypothetical protein
MHTLYHRGKFETPIDCSLERAHVPAAVHWNVLKFGRPADVGAYAIPGCAVISKTLPAPREKHPLAVIIPRQRHVEAGKTGGALCNRYSSVTLAARMTTLHR